MSLPALLQHTKPTSITYERRNDGRSLTQRETGERRDCWSIYYRFSAQQQFEQFQHNLKEQKVRKKHEREYVKERKLRPKHYRRAPRRKEYKPPAVDEPVIAHKKPQYVLDDRLKRQYIMYDLGRNQWITAFSTSFQWYLHRKEVTHCVGRYKLYVAFDEEECDRKMFGVEADGDDQPDGSKPVRTKRTKSKGNGNGSTHSKPATTRQRRKRERKQMVKEVKTKKMRDKLKWEYVGSFDGSMEDYWWSREQSFSVDKVHRLNHTVYCDPNSTQSMKKNYAQNGKLARWIKLVPCSGADALDKIKAQVYGVGVNAYSQPIIPYKVKHKNAPMLSGYTASDDGGYDSMDSLAAIDEDSTCDGSRAKNLQIGPRIQSEEIKERRGCRLIIQEKPPSLAYHRRIDGIDTGYWSPEWHFADIIDKRREHRRQSQRMKGYAATRSLSVDDWDINGIPRC